MIYEPVVEQGIRTMRTNKILQELYKDVDVVGDIKKKRLEWIRHLLRLDHGRLVKEIFEIKLEGRRRRGGHGLNDLSIVHTVHYVQNFISYLLKQHLMHCLSYTKSRRLTNQSNGVTWCMKGSALIVGLMKKK